LAAVGLGERCARLARRMLRSRKSIVFVLTVGAALPGCADRRSDRRRIPPWLATLADG
jgi:hypothetical protein